jgi:hypothetical protein
MIKKIMFLMSILSLCALCASNFVVKKEVGVEPKKKLSLAKRREQECQSLYDVLTDSFSLGRTVATVQERALITISDFVAASPSSVIAKADSVTLDSLHQCIEEHAQALRAAEATGKRLHAILSKL